MAETKAKTKEETKMEDGAEDVVLSRKEYQILLGRMALMERNFAMLTASEAPKEEEPPEAPKEEKKKT